MTTDDEWKTKIEAAQAEPVESVKAVTFVKSWPSASKPVAVRCDDGETYVAKSIQPGNAGMKTGVTAEQVVARLGRMIGAPVPEVVYVDVPQEMIDNQPEMAHMAPGLAHGLKMIPNCSEREGIDAVTSERNKKAYGRLAVLYGWCHAGDHQLVKTLDADADVYSVDHGHFFPGGPAWNAASLAGAPGPAVPDPQFAAHADADAQAEALTHAGNADDDTLAKVVGSSRPEWGVPIEDLVALAKFVSARRDTLVPQPQGDAQ